MGSEVERSVSDGADEWVDLKADPFDDQLGAFFSQPNPGSGPEQPAPSSGGSNAWEDWEKIDVAEDPVAVLLDPLLDVLQSVYGQEQVSRIQDDTPANKKDDAAFVRSLESFEGAVRAQANKQLMIDLRRHLLNRKKEDCCSEKAANLGAVQYQKQSDRFDQAFQVLVAINDSLHGRSMANNGGKANSGSGITSFLRKKRSLLLGVGVLAIGGIIWKLWFTDTNKKTEPKGSPVKPTIRRL